MAQQKLNKSLSDEPKRLRKNVSKKAHIKVVKAKGSNDTLWDEIAKLRAQIPEEEWDKLPTDLAKNVDHYLYGHKKLD
jgi:hypothetical protein